VTSKHPDEADRQKSGTLPTDPKDGTKVVAAKVPRVLTVKEILQASRERAMSGTREHTFTTGHYRLDQITGGLRRGFSWLVGADTSWGKSSWLISVADENIKLGETVLIVSFEDTEEVYGDRLMVRRAQVNAMRYRDRKLERPEMDKVLAVEKAAQQVPVFVDARRWNIEDLAPHLEKLIKERNVGIVAFDYIQEIKSAKRWQDEQDSEGRRNYLLATHARPGREDPDAQEHPRVPRHRERERGDSHRVRTRATDQGSE
jgi:replicative DNA helicase